MRVYVFCFAYVAGHILGAGIPVAFGFKSFSMNRQFKLILHILVLLFGLAPYTLGLAPFTLGLEPSTSLGHAWNQIIRYGKFVFNDCWVQNLLIYIGYRTKNF